MKLVNRICAGLRALYQLCVYFLLGIVPAIILSPTLLLIAIGKWRVKLLWLWIYLDMLVATVAHFTWKRTISGIAGERCDKYLRFHYIRKVINWLAKLFGDTADHCIRAYAWEIYEGYAK